MTVQGNHIPPAKISLKFKAITFISLLILAVGAVLSWYFLGQTDGILRDELRQRALSLAKNLAHNSKYGILTEDREILQKLIEGILQEDSVFLVLVTDTQGKVLAQQAKQSIATAIAPELIDMAVKHAAMLAPTVTTSSVHYHVLGNQGIYHTAFPVSTSPSDSEQSEKEKRVAEAIAVLGKKSDSASVSAPQTVRLGSVQLVMSLEKMRANIHKTFVTGIGLTLGIILVGVILAFVFCSYALAPVQAMFRAALQIAAGDLLQRVRVRSRDEIGVLAMTFNHMTESLDRMTQAQQQRLAELSALHAIGLVISSTLDLDRLIDLTLDAIVKNLGYDRAKLFLVDNETHALVRGRIAGASAEIQSKLRNIEIPLREDCGFNARVALSGEPLLVEDMEKVKDQSYRPATDLLGTRSLVAVPLKIEDRVLGVISVDNVRTNRTLTDADQRLLTTLANQIAIAIANAQAYRQIAQLNIGLEEKVQERTEALLRQQAQLREVNLQLEVANRHKSAFMANMSHELRTPLNAIIGFSEVLLERMFGDLNDKQEEYLDDILGSGKYLLSLINDILDLSKIEAGKLELEPGIVNLRQLLESSLVMVKERALSHGITLSLDMAEEIDTITGDERKVKQILFNLLANAVKFTPDGGRVGIRAELAGDRVQIAVWDTGVGIAPEDQQRVFEEFQQVGQGLTGKTEGTGLGLALTKRFVELHGGTIWVESTAGHGSTFTFTLPLETMTSDAAPLVAQEQTAPTWGADVSDAGPLVLIIEDDPKAADLLRIYLTEAGYSVDIARDGAEGLQKVRQQIPRAIILDVLLPKIDGWSFLAQMKANPATRDVPVVIVSIVDQKGKGFALGAADYLVKPIQKEELHKKLAAFNLLSQGQATAVKILAIDDDPKTLELLTTVLEPKGFRVLKAHSGEEGIKVASTEQPDLIILDLLMPGMNGFDVIDYLEQTPATKRLPVILFTVKQLTAEEKQRLNGRIAVSVQKEGFNREGFVGVIKEVLQRTLELRKQS